MGTAGLNALQLTGCRYLSVIKVTFVMGGVVDVVVCRSSSRHVVFSPPVKIRITDLAELTLCTFS